MDIRRIAAAACAALVAYAIPASPALAHPLDVSATTATVKPGGIEFVTYLHSYEAELLLGRAGQRVDGSNAYVEHAAVIADYVASRASISVGDGRACPLSEFSVPEQPMYRILAEGLETRFAARCDIGRDERISFRLDFFPDLPLQTNRLFVYDARVPGLPASPNASYVLTPRLPERGYDRDAPVVPKTDSDHDGLSDEDERIYRTDPAKPDTDGDNYSDYEEAMLGWNPLDPRLGPGQTERDEYAPFDLSTVLFTAGTGAKNDPNAKYASRYVKPTNLLDSS